MKKLILTVLAALMFLTVEAAAQNNSVTIKPITITDVETSFDSFPDDWVVLTNYTDRHYDDNPNAALIGDLYHPTRRVRYLDEIHNNLNETADIYDVKDFSLFQDGLLTKNGMPEVIAKNFGKGISAKDLMVLTTFDVTACHGIENTVNDPLNEETITIDVTLGSQYHLDNKPLILRYHADHYPKEWVVLADDDVVFDKENQTLKFKTDHLCVFALLVKKGNTQSSVNDDKKVAVNTSCYE